MSLYDNNGKKLRVSVKLTPHQRQKLKHICELFGKTHQDFFADTVDFFYCDLIEIQSGRIHYYKATEDTALKHLDTYAKVNEIKHLIPHSATFFRRTK